jgi:siroheme synthase (precorrin-2 oxidase/ferrochelatase)
MSYYNWESREIKETEIKEDAVCSFLKLQTDKLLLKEEIVRLNKRIMDLNRQIYNLHSAGDALVNIIDDKDYNDNWLPKWEKDALQKWLEAKELSKPPVK